MVTGCKSFFSFFFSLSTRNFNNHSAHITPGSPRPQLVYSWWDLFFFFGVSRALSINGCSLLVRCKNFGKKKIFFLKLFLSLRASRGVWPRIMIFKGQERSPIYIYICACLLYVRVYTRPWHNLKSYWRQGWSNKGPIWNILKKLP